MICILFSDMGNQMKMESSAKEQVEEEKQYKQDNNQNHNNSQTEYQQGRSNVNKEQELFTQKDMELPSTKKQQQVHTQKYKQQQMQIQAPLLQQRQKVEQLVERKQQIRQLQKNEKEDEEKQQQQVKIEEVDKAQEGQQVVEEEKADNSPIQQYKQNTQRQSCNLQSIYRNSIVQDAQKQQHQQQPQQINIPSKEMKNQTQTIHKFDPKSHSPTILISENDQCVTQNQLYYQNCKIALTQPITSSQAQAVFKIDNLKYCVGVGVAFKEVIQKHQYTYKSNCNELSHGLFIVTSQGYSWSHSEKDEDDILRQGFNQVYTGAKIHMSLVGTQLTFRWKKGQFTMTIPSDLIKKYTLVMCAYVHEKGDSISLQ